MKNKLRQHLEKSTALTDKEWGVLSSRLREQYLQRSSILSSAGRPSEAMHFVVKGSVRSFINRDEGEITWNFYFPDGIATDFQSFLTGEPSPLDFETLEDTLLITLDKQSLPDMYKEAPELIRFENLFARRAFLDMRQRMESFLLQSAEERYLNFLNRHPDIVSSLPGSYIATYLGLTPQSLSPIKRRLFKGK
ncbi:MAG TPA: Crp/Fnr family transcriptional regulator [Flavobacteriales bacterium]|nr:Crp/Fnr family transcriptional regulator [Flavobacteriales bacterium]